MTEVSSRHLSMMHRLKIDLALLNYEEYVFLMTYISKQKESLADHMNYVISSKLQSLDKEIVSNIWEETLTDNSFVEFFANEDDLWN